jgi:hypothetical protein
VQGPPIVTPTPIVRPNAPEVPNKLAAKAISQTRIDLSWTDNSNNESGFFIERSLDGINWGQIASVGANTTKYSDNGLVYGTKVYYRVRAYNSGGGSAYSNVVSLATPAVSAVIVGKVSTPTKLRQSTPLIPGSRTGSVKPS